MRNLTSYNITSSPLRFVTSAWNAITGHKLAYLVIATTLFPYALSGFLDLHYPVHSIQSIQSTTSWLTEFMVIFYRWGRGLYNREQWCRSIGGQGSGNTGVSCASGSAGYALDNTLSMWTQPHCGCHRYNFLKRYCPSQDGDVYYEPFIAILEGILVLLFDDVDSYCYS